MMTAITTLVALVPVMMATGRGADVARAMALPVFGGTLIEPFSSFILRGFAYGPCERRKRPFRFDFCLLRIRRPLIRRGSPR